MTAAFALESDAPAVAAAAPLAVPAAATSLLRFITCGSVDDGKSTLIGRLLYDANAVFDDQLEALKRDSKKFGTTGEDLDFALLVDGLSAEREQGITIDVAYRYFSTPKRAFIIADTPGHEQYTRNMATGASQAELAVILVDARKGILQQTRRHSFITSMVGIKSVIVAINKMDLVDFDQAVFDGIVAGYKEILPQLAFTDVSYIPLSAKNGDNITTRSPHTPWYKGETLLERLETATPSTLLEGDQPFRLPVQWVNRPNLDFRGYCGEIAGGSVRRGDSVTVLPAGRQTRVKAVYGPSGEVESAGAGEAVTLTLTDEVDVSRGDVIVKPGDSVAAEKTVKAEILWMVDRPLIPGARLIAKLGSAQTPASVRTLDHAIDIHTYQPRPADALLMNEIGRVTVAFDRPPVALPYTQNRELGAFILIDQLSNETVALGLVRETTGVVPAPGAAGQPASSATGLDRARALWFGADTMRRPERKSGVLRFRALASVLTALIAFLLGLGVFAALLLGVVDFLFRPFLRQTVDRTERYPDEPADPTVVGDGSGI
ncbi:MULTISPECIES: sulfate adenylyltransferase subunit CysN [unclassified Aureimonas]|uniref:sulfate adenylyltransferase subunit CysN n=1 Tax=unclassified Aureimonas TaxID=2615206 RepID=UPI0006F5172A|nr:MULTISPECIES: sulfate adenylyltransferase subunit CysN [unclassified Aureimonas]KQT65901.1 sulfate adenylyltransferase [Aureimonas sp. Leaf427]KQT73260.1 sulfate adenylyltransferase [Aureimonas sp. Leaf460]